MPYNATVKLIFKNNTDPCTSKYFPELLDQQTVTIESPAADLNIHQYFELYKGFLRAIGFDDKNIMKGAIRLAFDDSMDQEHMKEICEEYELIFKEDHNEKIAEISKKVLQLEEDTSNKDMRDQGMLKVTTNDPMKAWNGVIPGSPEAKDKGCLCPVLDNQEMPDDRKWIDVECPLHGRNK